MEFERALVSSKAVSLSGHAKKIVSLGWSSTGVLASGSSDNRVRVWYDVTAGPSSMRFDWLTGHTAAVDALAWSPATPTVLATGGLDKTLRVWDTRAGGRVALVLATRGQALHVGWSHDGNLLAVGTRDDIFAVADMRRAGGVAGGAAGGGATTTASSAVSGGADAGAFVLTASVKDELNEFAFAPNGCVYAGVGSVGLGGGVGVGGGGGGAISLHGGADSVGSLVVWDVSGSELSERARVVSHAAPITNMRFSPDFSQLATGAADSTVSLWDSASLSVVRTLDRSDAACRALSWNRAGSHLAVASGDREEAAARTLEVVRVSDGSRVATPSCAIGAVATSASAARFTTPLIRTAAWASHADILAFSYDEVTGPAANARGLNPTTVALEAGSLKVLVASSAAR